MNSFLVSFFQMWFILFWGLGAEDVVTCSMRKLGICEYEFYKWNLIGWLIFLCLALN